MTCGSWFIAVNVSRSGSRHSRSSRRGRMQSRQGWVLFHEHILPEPRGRPWMSP